MPITALASPPRRRSLAALAGGLTAVAIGLALAAGGGVPEPLVVDVDGNPSALAISGGRVWVAAPRTGEITVLDARTGHPAESPLHVGGTPARLALGTKGVWVADAESGSVFEVRRRDRKRVGADASDIVLAGGALWVASSADGRVYVLDGQGSTALNVARAPVALATDGRRVVVADSQAGTLTILDARTRKATGTIAVGGAPIDVALAGDTAWVADAHGRVVAADLESSRVTGVAVRRPVAVAPAGEDVYALADRELLRIRDGEIRSRRAVGSEAAALAVDRRSVWVAAGDRVLRFAR